jgi:hypothetical protein
VINPLRSEREAFQVLVWVIAVFVAAVVVVVLARAIF